MITRYCGGIVPASGSVTAGEKTIADQAQQVIAEFGSCLTISNFHAHSKPAWSLVGGVDKYIVENAPWSLGEKTDDASRAATRDHSVHQRGSLAHRYGFSTCGRSRFDVAHLGAAWTR